MCFEHFELLSLSSLDTAAANTWPNLRANVVHICFKSVIFVFDIELQSKKNRAY